MDPYLYDQYDLRHRELMLFRQEKPRTFDTTLPEDYWPEEFIWKNLYTGAPARFGYPNCPYNKRGPHIVKDHTWGDLVIAQYCDWCHKPLSCLEVPKELRKEQQMFFQWLAEKRQWDWNRMHEPIAGVGPLGEDD